MTTPFSITTSKNNDSPEQLNVMQSLWLKIEKHQKRNDNLIKKQNALFERFKEHTLPYEYKQCAAVAKRVSHLISFLDKKSFSDNQRDELSKWIRDEVDFLESHPFKGDISIDDLLDEIQAARKSYYEKKPNDFDESELDELREAIDEMFDGEMELSDEELLALGRDPSLMEAYIENMLTKREEQEANAEQQQEDIEEDEDSPFDDQDFHDYFNKEAYEDADAPFSDREEVAALERLFKSSQLNKMYKRLAFVLHPDKARNEAEKQEKHLLMQQVAEAKKSKDAFTLLKLYQEHVPNAEFAFDDKTLSAIEHMLENKVQELNFEHRELKQGRDLVQQVYLKFSARSKKATQERMDQHNLALEQEAEKLDLFVNKFKTVKAMSKVLSERIEQSKHMMFGNMPINLGELFGGDGPVDLSDFFEDDAPF